MGPTLGAVLPLAVGIAISPIPIIAAILMLLSPKARGTSIGFLIGWVAGIIVTVTVFIFLAAVIPQGGQDDPKPVTGVIQILLGTAALSLTIIQWRHRSHSGTEPAMPKWMNAIDSMTAGRGLLLGLALAAANPKNLLLAISAGVTIGSAGLIVGSQALIVVVFTAIAASTVTLPVIAYLVASTQLTGPLQLLRGWLVRNNSAVMTILVLVLGTTMIGKGIGNF